MLNIKASRSRSVPSFQCGERDGNIVQIDKDCAIRAQRDSSFISSGGESVLTSPTSPSLSLSDISTCNDLCQPPNQKLIREKVSPFKATMRKPSKDEPAGRRSTSGGSSKASRKALVGLLAKVMTSTSLSDTRKSDSRRSSTKQPGSNIFPTMPVRREAEGNTRNQESIDIDQSAMACHGYGTPASRTISRAASATTAAHSRGGPTKRLPKRSASERDDSLSCSSVDRDIVPRMPPRRRSFEKQLSVLSEEESRRAPTGTAGLYHCKQLDSSRRSTAYSNSTRSSGTSSGTDAPPLSGDQIQSFVLSRIPKFVQEQLAEDEWKRVFSAAASECKKSISAGSKSCSTTSETDLRPQEENNQTIPQQDSDEQNFADDDASTVVSALTCPTLFSQGRNEASSEMVLSTHTSSKASKTESEDSSLSARSWHEGSSTHANAPRLPSRCSRRMSAPISPTITRTLRRSATDLNLEAKQSKSVVFSEVHVRYYERILDVNPCTSSGPSVGIGWKYKDMKPIDLELVEDIETDARYLVLTRHEREKMLHQLGYTRVDIARAVRINLKIKNQRAQTYNNIRHERVEYLIEKSKRKVGKLLGFGAGRRNSSTVNSHDDE